MLYLLIDFANNDEYILNVKLKLFKYAVPLLKGTKDDSIKNAGPFIVQFNEEQKPVHEDLKEFGNYVLLSSKSPIDQLANHFREFIYQTVKEQEFFFRFWDPRVLQKFFPTCSLKQLDQFFRSVKIFLMKESANENAIGYFLSTEGKLNMEKSDLTKMGETILKERNTEKKVEAKTEKIKTQNTKSSKRGGFSILD